MQFKAIDPSEVPESVNTRKKGSKWGPAVEAVRAGKVVVIPEEDLKGYASLNSVRANIKVTFNRKGVEITVIRDPDTGDLYIFKKEPEDGEDGQ